VERSAKPGAPHGTAWRTVSKKWTTEVELVVMTSPSLAGRMRERECSVTGCGRSEARVITAAAGSRTGFDRT
jgi:hypothetical protein